MRLFIVLYLLFFPILNNAQHIGQNQLSDWESEARRMYKVDLDSSMFYAGQILNMAKTDSNAKEMAFALNWKGICFMQKGEADSADHYYKKAINFGEEYSQLKYVKMAKLNRGINFHKQGLFEESVKYSLLALEQFKEVGDSLGIAHAWYNLGNSFFSLKDDRTALDYYQKSKTLYLRKGSILNQANVLNAIGAVYKRMQRFDEAILEYRRSVELKKGVGGALYCASEYNNLANAFIELGNQDSAFFYYRLSAITANQLGEIGKKALAYLNLSKLYNTTLNTDSALFYGLKAQEIARETNDRVLLYTTAQLLSLAYANQKAYKKAYEAFVQYDLIADSVNSAEIQDRVNQLEKRYKLAEKDKEILEKKVALTKKNSSLKIQLLIIILLILMILSSGFWFNWSRLKRKKQHEQEMSGERTRIAMDLHDHLGAELTLISSELDLQAYQASNEKEEESLNKISNQVREANSQLRETVWSIRHDKIDLMQFVNQLEHFGERIFNRKEVKFTVEYSEEINAILSPKTALYLYRICQEALTNVMKHAYATEVNLKLELRKELLMLSVEDNGVGFVKAQDVSGYGLSNMKERIHALGGELIIEPMPSKGTSIQIKVNVKA